MHGLDSNLSVLRRWADVSDQPLPSDWLGWCSRNLKKSVEIRIEDPELVSLLDGTASAKLRADAIDGTWAAKVSPEDKAEAARRDEIENITKQGNPYGTDSTGTGANLTAQMRLQTLDPALASRLKESVQPRPNQWSEAVLLQEKAQKERLRQQSLRKGMAMAAADAWRVHR